ncbi:hypothetical protein C6P64_13675, partial [Malikia granosa]
MGKDFQRSEDDLNENPPNPARAVRPARSDGIRRGDRRCRPGRPGDRDPLEAIGRREGQRDQRL